VPVVLTQGEEVRVQRGQSSRGDLPTGYMQFFPPAPITRAMTVWNWQENAWKLGRSERNPCTGTQRNSRPVRITFTYWHCLKDPVVKKRILLSIYI